MDAYGGSDEDSVELRKLLAEVVSFNQLSIYTCCLLLIPLPLDR